MVAVYLERSKSLPLSLEQLFPSEFEEEWLEVVLTHQHRWAHVTISIELELNLRRLEAPMPLLQFLNLSSGLEMETNTSITLAPLLRTVVLAPFRQHPIDFLPWAQLTALTLNGCELEHCTAALRHTTNLIYLRIEFCNAGTFSEIEEDDIHLPHLETLELLWLMPPEEPSLIFSMLVCPALQSIEVAKDFLEKPKSSSFRDFITKSNCHLKRCRIPDAAKAVEDKWTSRFPTIEFTFGEGNGVLQLTSSPVPIGRRSRF
jgi:hypothetical protein